VAPNCYRLQLKLCRQKLDRRNKIVIAFERIEAKTPFMENSPAIAEVPPTAAAAPAAADAPQAQPDLVKDLQENADLSQLDTLFQDHKLALQPAPGGEGDQTPPPAEKVETAKAGEPPPPAETAPAQAEVKKDEVVETRTPEEIAAAAEADRVKAEADAKAKEEAEISGIERPRLKDERDQLIAGVYMKAKREGKPITWAEAETRVDGPKVEAAAPVVEAPVDHTAIVGTLETEVADIKKKLDDAGASEGLFNSEIAKLTQDLADKTSDLKLAKRDAKIAADQAAADLAASRAESEKNRAAAIAEAKRAYPDAADDTTVLGKAVADEIAAMRDPNHPDHAFLYGDSIPFLITQKVAAKLGIAPVAAKPAAATPPPAKAATVTAPPRVVVSPAPGNKTAVVPGKPAEDPQKIVEYLKSDEATLEDLDAAQGAGDMGKLLAHAAR
jgi:hypothetical protein